MSTRIILLRHGETIDNINRVVQGHIPGKLTKLGKEQAKKVGERLKNEDIDVIYSSDLKRAKDTAREVAKYHKIKIIYDKRIRERNYGIYEGKPSTKLQQALKKSGKDRDLFKPKGGENRFDLESRSKNFFKEIISKYDEKTVLIISHGGFLLATLIALMNDSYDNYKKYLHHNTGITVLNVKQTHSEYSIKIEKINCTKHLK